MPTLYIVTGLPYAGKTSLTNKLKNTFGYLVTSTDEFLDGRFVVSAMMQKDWDEVYAAGYNKVKEQLATGNNVIFDGGSLLKSERDALRNIAAEAGAHAQLIYVQATPEEIRTRWQENAESNVREQLEESTLHSALAMFEEPTEDEHPLIYHLDTDPDQWITANLVR